MSLGQRRTFIQKEPRPSPPAVTALGRAGPVAAWSWGRRKVPERPCLPFPVSVSLLPAPRPCKASAQGRQPHFQKGPLPAAASGTSCPGCRPPLSSSRPPRWPPQPCALLGPRQSRGGSPRPLWAAWTQPSAGPRPALAGPRRLGTSQCPGRAARGPGRAERRDHPHAPGGWGSSAATRTVRTRRGPRPQGRSGAAPSVALSPPRPLGEEPQLLVWTSGLPGGGGAVQRGCPRPLP